MITGIVIGGAPVDPAMVITEAITVMHGRSAVDAEPSAGSASLSLLASQMPPWSVGDTLEVESEWGPLFTGVISDRAIPEHVPTLELGMCARIELTGAGVLAILGVRPVGDEPWPQEPSTARADRVLALAGVPYVVNQPPHSDLEVNPRDIDSTTALDVLTDLAADTAAAVVDLPDGQVLYQPLTARAYPRFYYRWQDFPPDQMWQDFDGATTWADFEILSPAAKLPLAIPAGAIEWEPQWQSTMAGIINSTRLGYGVPAEGAGQDYTAASDAASIARYGPRHYGAQTELARLADAQAMAAHIMSTRAWERWALGSVDVHLNALDPDTAAAVAALRCGDWVEISGLPQPAPAISWAGICEGWAYREHVDRGIRRGQWTLALSDPLFSLAVPTWADHTPAHQWQAYSPLHTWADLTDLEAIGA